LKEDNKLLLNNKKSAIMFYISRKLNGKNILNFQYKSKNLGNLINNCLNPIVDKRNNKYIEAI
jgi:hypothetical protein